MAERRPLPAGLTPRLLSRDEAATYLGVSAPHFDAHVAQHVRPVEIGKRRLWDIKALDRWLDGQAGFAEASSTDWLGRLGEDDRAHSRR
jgi:hypothetical protein